MSDLVVELKGQLVGHLRGDDWRTFDFEVDPAAFDRFDIGSAVLSEAVPFTRTLTRGRAARRRNFFGIRTPRASHAHPRAVRSLAPGWVARSVFLLTARTW
jgi:serine/threonine-protein kinase HipA